MVRVCCYTLGAGEESILFAEEDACTVQCAAALAFAILAVADYVVDWKACYAEGYCTAETVTVVGLLTGGDGGHFLEDVDAGRMELGEVERPARILE